MTTPEPPHPATTHPGGLTGWVDERIHVISGEIFTDENIQRLAAVLLPAIETMVKDLIVSSADRVIGDVGAEIHTVGDALSGDINAVVDNVGQEIAKIGDSVTGNIRDLLPPFLK